MVLYFKDRFDILTAMIVPMSEDCNVNEIILTVLNYFGKRFKGKETEVADYIRQSLENDERKVD